MVLSVIKQGQRIQRDRKEYYFRMVTEGRTL